MRNKYFAVIVILFLCAAIVTASAPSLVWNNDVWYKDSAAPLIFRDGVYYVPAEMCAMSQNITVSSPSDDSLLIKNDLDGRYISILINEGTAAVNGKIENIGVFRSAGIYYAEADKICEAVGLETEYYTSDDGTVTLRISDGETVPLKQILEPEAETPAEKEKSSSPGFIFILVRSGSGNAQICHDYGLPYITIVSGNETDSELLEAASHGGLILPAPDGSYITSLAREKIESLFGKKQRTVLTTGSADADSILEASGCIVIKPVYDDILSIIETAKNGSSAVILLDEFEDSTYVCSVIKRSRDTAAAGIS